MRAFIVIDLQNDFCPGGALPVHEGDRVVPLVNRLLTRFELVVASKDWHPPDHGSFAANHRGRRVGEQIDLDGLPQVLWPVHCVADTPGAAFHPQFDQARVDAVFLKGTDPAVDSYSCFFDNGHRRGTGLQQYLAERGVEEVVLAGLASDYCVRFSALDAVRLGLRTRVVLEACRGVELAAGDVQRAVAEMWAAGVEIVPPDALQM